MRAVDVIRKKRDGQALTKDEIETFVTAATKRTWPEYQVSALLMAIVLRGMDAAETAALTGAMVHSGERLDLSDLPGVKVDKHSTGGVGDKTSLILAPLAAACGVVVPMMSGRGLGHTGGTLDKLEAIPGFRVGLSLPEFRAALRAVGCALIGQTAEVAPADKVLYALRDVTATVESIPLISASIMSKKIAEGIGALVLDVKCGSGAFMKTHADAKRLAESLVAIGTAQGVRTEALLTAMDQPLGRAVGNALEVIECIETLKGRGPADIEALSVQLAARMVRLAGRAATLEEAETQVRAALTSGRGVEKVRAIIAQQGGDAKVIDDYARLPAAPHREMVRAERGGYCHGFEAERVGRAAVVLGAGRDRVEDGVDPAVGAIVLVRRGERVKEGEPLLELHYRDAARLAAAKVLLKDACSIRDEAPAATPLVLELLAEIARAERKRGAMMAHKDSAAAPSRFDSLEQEVFLNLWRTYDRLRAFEEELFGRYDLTPQQYNVLRLLRAQHPNTTPTLALANRLISRAPDITRILDKLEKRGLIVRERTAANRRVVRVGISEAGLDLLVTIAAPLRACHARQLGHLSEEELKQLAALLQEARAPHEEEGSVWG